MIGKLGSVSTKNVLVRWAKKNWALLSIKIVSFNELGSARLGSTRFGLLVNELELEHEFCAIRKLGLARQIKKQSSTHLYQGSAPFVNNPN